MAVFAPAIPVVAALALASSSGAEDVHLASVETPVPIEGYWRFSPGDDPAFAASDFNDGAWPLVEVPRGLGEQGYRDLVGVYWLRVRVHFPVAPSPRELSLRLGPVDSACEVFIDGERVGGNGRVSSSVADALDAHDRPSLWPVPLQAMSDGELVVAIRAWRNPLRADAAPARGGITAGPVLLGRTDDIVRAQYRRDLDKLLAGFTVLVVGLYHLQLFRRRREQRDYLWFGAFCLLMGTNLLTSTDASIAFLGTMPHARLMWASLILALPTFLQFLWPLVGRPIRWWWRANQLCMMAYALVAVVWPTQWFVIKFIGWFELLLLLPLMVGTTVVIVVSASRGNPEARTLLLGTLGLVVAAGNNVLLERTTLQLPDLMSYAMALLVFSIAVSLANRYSRVFRELDQKNAALARMDHLAEEVLQLNKHVQLKVKDRSDELSKALTSLSHSARLQGHLGSSIAAGTTLDGRFVIERALGAGGMGAVHAGRDLVTNMPVAVKIMATSSVSTVDALHRFLREARAVVAVDHPAIVRMLHVDISGDGVLYQVQELVEGVTLEVALRHATIDAALVARAGAVLADALAAAHASGVIHRDVKPSNIMVTRAASGMKLLDFGVAKLTMSPATSDHTGTGRFIGTPAYMAPEQRFIADAEVTDRVDVYALGLVLHRALYGCLPGRTVDGGAHIPAALRQIVGECLREDPAARPSSRTLASALSTIADTLGAARALTSALEWSALLQNPEPIETPEGARGVTELLRELVRPA